MIVIKVK